MEKLVAIIGAGASAGVHNDTVPVNDQSQRPPLARELFDKQFWTIRSPYVGAEVLGTHLGRLAIARQDPFELESRLSEYASSTDFRTRRHFKDVPPYLRDIFIRISRGSYVSSPNNYIDLVRRLLENETHQVLFVVLNYDTLLEQALTKYDRRLTFMHLDDYIAPDRQALVVKVHGSIDWGVPMEGSRDIGWLAAVDNFEPTSAGDRAIRVFRGQDDSLNWRAPENGEFLYPRLTAPVKGKTFCCPEAHTQALVDFAANCHKFLIIGTSGLDDDLLEALDPPTSGRVHVVQYVDNGEAADVQQRFEAKVPYMRPWNPSSTLPRLSDAGFADFLDTDELERLLAAD